MSSHMDESPDLGIPSDSPYHPGDPWTVRPVRYPAPAYVPTRFGNRTICDLPDEHESAEEWLTNWQARADHWWRVLRMVAVAALVASAVAVLVWDHYDPPPRQAVPMVMGFEGGQ